MGHPRCRLHPSPDHVPDDDPQLAAAQHDRVVPIAADFGLPAARAIPGRESKAGDLRQTREEVVLKSLAEVALDLDPGRG